MLLRSVSVRRERKVSRADSFADLYLSVFQLVSSAITDKQDAEDTYGGENYYADKLQTRHPVVERDPPGCVFPAVFHSQDTKVRSYI